MGIVINATAEVDPQVWEEVKAVLKCHDFTVSDAFRLMLLHTALGKELPFDCIVPNAETIAAMQGLHHGDLPVFTTVEELMADLNSDYGDDEGY